MLPPEMTQTTLPEPAWPARAAATEVAAAPSATTRLRSARSLTAAAACATEVTRAPEEQRARERPHLREHGLAADAVHEARRVRDGDGAARGERGRKRRRGLDLGRPDASFRAQGPECRRDAAGEAAAAERHDDRVHVRKVFQDLEPDRRVSGDDGLVADRMDEVALDPGIAVVFEDLPPARIGELHRLRAQALDRGELCLRRGLGDDDRAGMPSLLAFHPTPWAMLPALRCRRLR
jgi:hypothetical protein